MKFNKNRSKGSGDMERTQKCYGLNDGWRYPIIYTALVIHYILVLWTYDAHNFIYYNQYLIKKYIEINCKKITVTFLLKPCPANFLLKNRVDTD